MDYITIILIVVAVVESSCAVRCRRLLAGLKQLGTGAAGARGRNGDGARWLAEQQHRDQIALRWAIRSKVSSAALVLFVQCLLGCCGFPLQCVYLCV